MSDPVARYLERYRPQPTPPPAQDDDPVTRYLTKYKQPERDSVVAPKPKVQQPSAPEVRKPKRIGAPDPILGAYRKVGTFVVDEVKRGGAAIAESARQLKNDPKEFGKGLAKGVFHGVVDPIVTMGKTMASPEEDLAGIPDAQRTTGLASYKRETERLASVAADNARRNTPGEFSEDAAEEAASQVRAKRKRDALLAPVQNAVNIAAPGIFKAASKAVAPVATRALGKVAGKVAADLTGEAAAGATAMVAQEPEHPISAGMQGATLGVALGSATRGIGKGITKGAEAAKPVVERARGATQDALTRLKRPPEADSPAERVYETTKNTPAETVPGQVNIRRMNVEEIETDPLRFQYKSGTDASTGTGAELKGLSKFDESLAGVVSVWRDPANGKVYAVNGHHRLELAKRTGHPSINIQEIPAKTAAGARAAGALANIAEGRGTATDAAQFFRDSGLGPDDLKERVSFKGAIARQGMGLSKLAPDLFDKVVRGDFPEGSSAVIGNLIAQPELQRAAVTAIEKAGKRLSDGEVREVARQVLDAGSERTTQDSLFGTESVEVPLYVEKAQLAAAITKRLGSDKRLFGYVAKEGRAGELARAGNQIDVEGSRRIAEEAGQLEEVFRTLYTRSGPIANALNEAARKIANGEKPNALIERLYLTIREAVQEALGRGEGARDSTLGVRDQNGESQTGYDTAGRQVAGPEESQAIEGHALDSTDPAQNSLLSPRAEVQDPSLVVPGANIGPEGRNADGPLYSPDSSPDLFGESKSVEPAQESFLSAKEGTAASRSLSETERASVGRISKLRQMLQLEIDPQRRIAVARELAQHEKLVNRGRSISAEELATRIEADESNGLPSAGPDQGVLLSPASDATLFGARFRRTLGLKNSVTGDVVALRKISQHLAEAIGVPLREGRGNLKRMRANGAFWKREEVVRVRRLKALDTVSHEVGHYLSKKYDLKLNAKLLPKADRVPVVRELLKMGHDLYGDRKPNGGYAEEGVAQFFRFMVTDRERMVADAPSFTRYMETVLEREPALRDILNKAHDDWKAYEASPANAKLASMIEQGVPSRLEGVSSEKLIDHWFNDLKPIHRAVEAIGVPGKMSENAAILAELTKGNAGRARDMLDYGVIDFNSRERTTRGLAETLKDIGEKDRDAFSQYIVAEQVLTKTGQGIDTGFDVEAAKEVVTKGRANPRFVQAAKEVWDFRSGLLKYVADAGLMTQKELAAIRAGNPTPTPFYRAGEVGEAGGGRDRTAALAKNSSGVFRMTGSDRPILDPLQSIVHDAYTMTDRAQKHYAATVLIKTALASEGGGHIAQLLPEIPKEARRIGIDRVREQLIDAGWTPPNDPSLVEALGSGTLEAFYEKKRPGVQEARDQVIAILIDGERKWVQINDQATWEALEGMTIPGLGIYEQILTAPTRTLRLGATQSNPDFALVNPIRDAFPASIYSAGRTHLPGWHLANGVFHLLRSKLRHADELTARWAQEGAENAGMIGADRRAMTKEYIRTVHEMTRDGQTAFIDVVKHPVRAMRKAFEVFENGTRLGEFAEVRSERMKAGMPEIEASVEGAYSSRNVTQDFFKAGRTSRIVNRYVPFFSAQLGDIYKLSTEFNPANLKTPEGRARYATITARAVAYITVPSLMLYLLQHDDEDFQEIPEYYRANAWVIVDKENGPIPFTLRSGKQIRIWAMPRPYLLGYVFGYMPEKILGWAKDNDPDALSNLAKYAWSAFAPSFIPTIIGPPIENFANRSTYSGRPIVPRQVEGLEPSEQSQQRTGETARLIGQVTNSSPAKIENVVRGYFGGAGQFVKGGVDAVVTRAEKAVGRTPLAPPNASTGGDPLDRTPVIGRFILSQPGADAQSVSKLFTDYTRAEMKRQTWMAMLKAGQARRAEAYLKENQSEIESVATKADTGGEGGALRQVHKALTDITRERREVAGSNLPPSVKAQKARELGQLERTIARNYYHKNQEER